MFSFSKNINEVGSVKKDTVIFDYLARIDKELGKYGALYICMSKLQNQTLKNVQRMNIVETFDLVTKRSGGYVFALSNDDFVVIYTKRTHDEMMACLIKVRFMLQDDPALRSVVDLVQAGFVKVFDFRYGCEDFRRAVKQAIKDTPNIDPSLLRKSGKNDGEKEPVIVPGAPLHKSRRELTPHVLAKVQKALSQADFSNLIRRQSVCAVIGKAPPQMIFDEVYVSIADMRDSLLPDVDMTSNPWLFQHLTETLDQRVLINIGQHDDGSLRSNFSLNLNVSTVLSDDFLAFDDTVSPTMRSSIVLELQLVDILSDVKAYTLARTFAQYRGYKICIDAISVDKLEYINREFLSSDLMKIIWDPAFVTFASENSYFREKMTSAERSKLILCRVDDSQAIEVGNSLGINLYQGRLIQKMLAAKPKKTIYRI